jgi:tripartite-type tricarboxylate transporter receptor subunit TctC
MREGSRNSVLHSLVHSQFCAIRIASVLCLLSSVLCLDAAAQAVGEFYHDKTIKLVVSTAAGGEYDLWARLLVRHMGRHLAGNPGLIVVNMPGAGGITAANHLFNIAERDGTVIGMIGRNLPYQALVRQSRILFDPLKFNWLGSPELTNRVCVAIDGASVQRAADLFERELLVGGAGAGTAVSTTPVLLSKLLGMRFRLVEGYGSPNAILLAMERGEVQGICVTVSALRSARPGWIESGKLKVLFNTEHTPPRDLTAPSIFEFAKTDEQRRILALYSSSVELGRPIVAPPGVPGDRVQALRRAFEDAMADPLLRNEAEKQQIEINVVRGDGLARLVSDLMRTPRDLVAKMEALTR